VNEIWNQVELEKAFSEAISLFQAAQLKDARAYAMAVIEFDQKGARAWYLVACAAERDDEFELAQYALQQALKLDPSQSQIPEAILGCVDELLKAYAVEIKQWSSDGESGSGAPASTGLLRFTRHRVDE